MENNRWIDIHNHLDTSNIRLIDAICTLKGSIARAKEIGLKGIAFTDHECLSNSIEICKVRKDNPELRLAIGNEIYLTNDRSKGQKYYHFILVAKDAKGHRQLRELSSRAWLQGYMDKGLKRVPTLKTELAEVVLKDKGHLIASNACFKAGTKVLTKNGNKNIEDITSDDYVFNRFGEWEKVNFPTQRNYNGDGYKILFLGNPVPTICTANHQFLVTTNNKIRNYRVRGTNPIFWIGAEDLITTKGATKHICLFPLPKIEYNNNSVLKREEWENIFTPKGQIRKKIADEIKITPEVMRLFGLYLGDGSTTINFDKNYYAVNLTFSEEEFPFYYNDFVKKASAEIGIEWSIQKRPKYHRVDLTTHNIDFVKLFYYLFRNLKANNKEIPNRLLHISEELDINLVMGYELADGHFRPRITNGYNTGEMISTSISKTLTLQIQELLKSLRIRSSFTISKEHTGIDNVHHQESYYLTSSGKAWGKINKKESIDNEKILSIFKEAQEIDSKKHIEIDGILYKKVYIKEKEKILLNEQVYCLNVDSHSFVCNNVIVHNCLGSESSINILNMEKARRVGDTKTERECYQNICDYFDFCLNLFGDDFYIELPPGASKEQIIVNTKLFQIAKVYNIKCEISCDSHYLKKEDRYLHEAFLKSVDGEREVASFYEYSYMQDEDDIIKNIEASFGGLAQDVYKHCCETSKEIYNKIEEYDLRHNQTIPKVEVKDYKKSEELSDTYKDYPNLSRMFVSNDIYERYWINECFIGFDKKGIKPKEQTEYLDELEKEADIKRAVGERLGTNIFCYPITLKHYIDMFWEMGSIVGAGRGSAGAGLNHWLLGITQSNPLRYNLPFERYMNWDTTSLPDIDLDMCPSKRPTIIQKIKENRGKKFYDGIDDISKANLGCTLVATFSTTKPKRAILMACKGYRSEDYPEGIDNDVAQYIASLIPSERGFLYSIEDCVYGNEEKGRKPQQTFIKEVNKYEGLLDIILGLSGLTVGCSSHASGVIFFDEDPYEYCCFMTTPRGDVITQYDLGSAESAGRRNVMPENV